MRALCSPHLLTVACPGAILSGKLYPIDRRTNAHEALSSTVPLFRFWKGLSPDKRALLLKKLDDIVCEELRNARRKLNALTTASLVQSSSQAAHGAGLPAGSAVPAAARSASGSSTTSGSPAGSTVQHRVGAPGPLPRSNSTFLPSSSSAALPAGSAAGMTGGSALPSSSSALLSPSFLSSSTATGSLHSRSPAVAGKSKRSKAGSGKLNDASDEPMSVSAAGGTHVHTTAPAGSREAESLDKAAFPQQQSRLMEYQSQLSVLHTALQGMMDEEVKSQHPTAAGRRRPSQTARTATTPIRGSLSSHTPRVGLSSDLRRLEVMHVDGTTGSPAAAASSVGNSGGGAVTPSKESPSVLVHKGKRD